MTAPTFLRPIAGDPEIGDDFAEHLSPSRPGGPSANPGVDYKVGTGTNVLMPADGFIAAAKWSSLVGNWLGINFDNGWGSDLLHNASFIVPVGHWYAEGTHIAESGGTGSAATGPHLHWSLRTCHGHFLENFQNVNPELYLGPSNTGDEDMKLYEDIGGPGGPLAGHGPLWVCGDGKARAVDLKLPNIRAISAAAFGSPIGMHTADLEWVLAQYRDVPAGSGGGGLTTEQDTRLKATSTSAEVKAVGTAVATLPKPPTAEQIGAEVIRQQKLPGN